MATAIALILSLAVYTGTIVGINYRSAPEGAPLNFDIYNAAESLSVQYGLGMVGIPEPFHWAFGCIAIIIPALLCFSIVRFVIR
ncbi:hypothetical protein MnTg02_02682 [bacterium MnTg02]|nr:hypothetical protein MnTg02_02682 [bacterium MnTg02]